MHCLKRDPVDTLSHVVTFNVYLVHSHSTYVTCQAHLVHVKCKQNYLVQLDISSFYSEVYIS